MLISDPHGGKVTQTQLLNLRELFDLERSQEGPGCDIAEHLTKIGGIEAVIASIQQH
jgi:hypothetical protein